MKGTITIVKKKKTYSEEISVLELKTRSGWDCDISVLFRNDGFKIKPKYYSLKRFLFLTRVLSLQDAFLRNMFYFIAKKTS